MATPGRPLPEDERRRIIRLRAMGLSIRRVAHEQMVSTRTVQKVLRKTA
jgi:transposase